MIAPLSQRYLPAAQAALRIGAGSGYFVHATQKRFWWFGGFDRQGGAAELMSKFGAAGVIEVMLYSFLFLVFAALGAEPLSVDSWLERRRRQPG